jgi:hypothetical protein
VPVLRQINTYRQALCPECDAGYKEGIRLDKLGEPRNGRIRPWRKYDRVNVHDVCPTVIENPPLIKFDDGIPFDAPALSVDEASASHNRWADRAAMKLIAPKKFTALKDEDLDRFLEIEHFDASGNRVRKIVRPGKLIGLNERSRPVLARHHKIVTTALKSGCIPRIVNGEDESISDQPLFLDPSKDPYEMRLPLMPGQRLKYSQLPVSHNKMTNCVVDKEHPSVIVLVHAYKNDPKSCRRWAEFCLEVKKLDLTDNGDFEKFEKLYKAMGPLICNGFSGSMMKSDLKAPTAQVIGKGDPAYTAGHLQSSSQNSNAIFERLKDQRRPVALFICEDLWGEQLDFDRPVKKHKKMTEQQEKDADCLFIGYFTIWTRIEHPEFTRAQVLKRFEGMADYMKAQEVNLTHLRNGFFEYHLKPAFPANIIREIARWVKNGTVLQDIRVWELEERPLTVAYEDIRRALTDERITCY